MQYAQELTGRTRAMWPSLLDYAQFWALLQAMQEIAGSSLPTIFRQALDHLPARKFMFV